ncbi:MAG: hypothetical protein HZB55_10585 [Deltaproteobacteria bacterium]|nr:hypothetical protein [Deltaproteobacteria bacterium]
MGRKAQQSTHAKPPWSIASLLRKEEADWARRNDLRRRLRHHWFDREILKGGEHPIRYAFSLAILLVSAIVLGHALPKEWFTAYPSVWADAEKLNYFTSLWNVQATIAALVYPFVISFVALLLQRKPSSKAFLQIYLVDSGGLVAGMSSMFLVLAMSVQYVMLTAYSLGSAVTWVAVDAIWFMYNVVLTLWFLFRTVEFLRSDFQMEVVKRYAANVALPREIAHLLRFQVFARAQKEGWIPGPSYLDDEAEGQPQVLMHSFGAGMGDVSVERYLQEQSRLTNVFLWPLRLVVAGWLKKARQQHAIQSSGPSKSVKSPLLVFPLLPGSTYEAGVVLARVEGGPNLTPWHRLLVRLSFRFTPFRLERRHVTLTEILADLETDARVSAGTGDVATFEEGYRRITGMHETLIGASLTKEADGNMGSLALVPDVLKFADRPVHVHWADSYRSLFDASTSILPKETRPIRRLCYVVQHLDGPELRRSPADIRDRILLLPTQLMFALGNWWSERLEEQEQGVLQHDANGAAVLRPPLQGAYEGALLHLVSGWDSARGVVADIPGRDDRFIWANVEELLKLNARHVNETCLMLLRAVARGDQIAAEWLADILSKWWATASGYDDEPIVLYGKTDFITAEALFSEWDAAEQSLGIDDNDRRFIGQDRPELQRHVFLAALKNYWRDIRLLTLEILVSWAGSEGPRLSERSLATYVAGGLLTGRQWRPGGRTEEPLSDLTATDYLTAKARQYGADSGYRQGYVARLDAFVESAKDILRPPMVPGRIYSSSGADDVESLQDAQLAVFVILSGRDWRPGESLRRQLAIWTSSSFRSTNQVKHRVEAMGQRLVAVGDSLCPELVDRLLSSTGKTHTRPEGLARTRDAISAICREIEDLQSNAVAGAQVSTRRLAAMEEAASERGFSVETGKFPLQLFAALTYQDTPQEPFTLIFSKLRKGEFTDVEMAQRAVNEREHYAETIARHVGVLLLADVIRKSETRDVLAPDATAYWAVLKEEARALQEVGLTPVLVLDNPTRPGWVWEWQHPRQDGRYPRPPDLVFRREKPGRGDGYVADFNDIQVFSAGIAPGESLLLAREAFAGVTFKAYRDRVFVKAETSEVAESTTLVDLQLTFERDVRVEHSKIVRIRYQTANSEPGTDE